MEKIKTETIAELRYNTNTCTIILKDGTEKVYTGEEAKRMFEKYKEPESIKENLKEAITKAKPNLDKIKDVDKWVNELRRD